MKYLKFFENHNVYYELVPEVQFSRVIYIDDYKKNEIDNYCGIETKKTENIYNYNRANRKYSILFFEIPENGDRFYIHMDSDDWFYVIWIDNTEYPITSKKYKCDQLEGLKKFFDNEVFKTV